MEALSFISLTVVEEKPILFPPVLYCFKSLGPTVADGSAVRVSAVAGRSWLSSPNPKSHPTSDHWFLFRLTCSPLRRRFHLSSDQLCCRRPIYFSRHTSPPLRMILLLSHPPLRREIHFLPLIQAPWHLVYSFTRHVDFVYI